MIMTKEEALEEIKNTEIMVLYGNQTRFHAAVLVACEALKKEIEEEKGREER